MFNNIVAIKVYFGQQHTEFINIFKKSFYLNGLDQFMQYIDDIY